MQQLYEKYHNRGFEVLDFPCNQFGEQAPGSYDEIHAFCTGTYFITFPQMAKIEVGGDRSGKVVKRFEPTAKKDEIDAAIVTVL